jgi:hypothetical protein
MQKIIKKEDVYKVEQILKKRVFRGRTSYFIKWEGYPNSENTWEPLENLKDNCLLMINEFENDQKRPQKQKSKLPPLCSTNAKPIKESDISNLSEAKLVNYPGVESDNKEIGDKLRKKINNRIQPQSNMEELQQSKSKIITPQSLEEQFKEIEREIKSSKIVKRDDFQRPTRNIVMNKKRGISRYIDPSCYDVSSDNEIEHQADIEIIHKPEVRTADIPDLIEPNKIDEKTQNIEIEEVSNYDDKSKKKQVQSTLDQNFLVSNDKINAPAAPLTSKKVLPLPNSKFLKKIGQIKMKPPVPDQILPLENKSLNVSLNPNDNDAKTTVLPQAFSSDDTTADRTITNDTDDKLIHPVHLPSKLRVFNPEEDKIFEGLSQFETEINGHYIINNEIWLNICLVTNSGKSSLGYFGSEFCRLRVPQQLCKYYEKFLKIN